jgi:hypothetical protein
VPAFESQALYRDNGFVTGAPGSAEGIRGMAVTTTFFDVLRTPPYRGRTFKDEDGVEGRNRVAILSYGFWRRASAGSDAAIGLGAGVAGTVALRQVIALQLYGVAALDPIVLASVSGVLVVAACLACFHSRRRASRVDPVVALAQR